MKKKSDLSLAVTLLLSGVFMAGFWASAAAEGQPDQSWTLRILVRAGV